MASEEYNDKLEQLILDENATVTYKLLSKELKIHVNEAKKCLYDFLKLHKSKEDVTLFAYYFLSGIVNVDGIEARKIVIVSENNLEKVKTDFKEVKSCHIYSLSKECQDESAIYKCQSWCKKWAEEHKEFSAIKHPSIIIKEPNVQKFVVKKFDTNIAASTKSSTVKQLKKEGAPSLFSNNSTKNSTNNKLEFEKKLTTDESQTSNILNKNESVNGTKIINKPSSSKTTLGSLWQKLEDKSKKGKKDDSPTEIVKSNSNSKAAMKTTGQNNILSMFSRQSEKNTSDPVKQVINNSVPPPTTNTHTAENIHDNNVIETHNKETVDKICKNGKGKSSQRKSKRSAKQSNDIESDEDIKPRAKKHRRICTMDDSDSESESEESKDKAQRSLLSSEEPTDVSLHISDDNEDPIPPTPPVLLSKGKKKIWKTVQKTFKDEDGFLVSKQEKILVSASDSDEDPIDSKKSISNMKSKQDTFSYRKQTSLTSFFK